MSRLGEFASARPRARPTRRPRDSSSTNSGITMRRRLGIAAGGLLAAGLLVGCGEGGPHLVPVSGTVTLNGNTPLERAEVTFVPDPTNKDVTPGGDMTGPEGNFKARYSGRAGLAPGKYKVLISKKAEPPPGMELPEAIKVDRVQQEMMGIRKETLPAQYTEAAKSEEYVEVKDGQDNIFDFDVKVAKSK